MKDFLSLLLKRRSIRRYTGEPIPQDKLDCVLKAGLLYASGHARYPVEFILVQKRETLEKLSRSRVGSASMLRGAQAAVVVIADSSKSDTITEDSSIAMDNMLLMAAEQGLGACWIQIRLRTSESGESSDSYLRSVLGYPDSFRAEAILSLGIPAEEKEDRSEKDLRRSSVHCEEYGS